MTDIKSILVLSFNDVTVDHGDSGMIKCPLCGNYFEAGKVPPDAAGRLTETVVDLLRRNTSISTIMVHDRNTVQGIDRIPERQLLTRAGREAGADAVLTGYIYRYEDRIGTNFAADRPASVALSIHMIRVSDGTDIWSGVVDETQQALAENLFKTQDFLRRKGRWVTADEMAASGIEKVFEGFVEK